MELVLSEPAPLVGAEEAACNSMMRLTPLCPAEAVVLDSAEDEAWEPVAAVAAAAAGAVFAVGLKDKAPLFRPRTKPNCWKRRSARRKPA